MGKGSEVKNNMVVPLNEHPKGLVINMFHAHQLHHVIFWGHCSSKLFYKLCHICSKVLMLLIGSFWYHSHAHPSKVKENILHL